MWLPRIEIPIPYYNYVQMYVFRWRKGRARRRRTCTDSTREFNVMPFTTIPEIYSRENGQVPTTTISLFLSPSFSFPLSMVVWFWLYIRDPCRHSSYVFKYVLYICGGVAFLFPINLYMALVRPTKYYTPSLSHLLGRARLQSLYIDQCTLPSIANYNFSFSPNLKWIQ